MLYEYEVVITNPPVIGDLVEFIRDNQKHIQYTIPQPETTDIVMGYGGISRKIVTHNPRTPIIAITDPEVNTMFLLKFAGLVKPIINREFE